MSINQLKRSMGCEERGEGNKDHEKAATWTPSFPFHLDDDNSKGNSVTGKCVGLVKERSLSPAFATYTLNGHSKSHLEIEVKNTDFMQLFWG